jgi:ribosome maturation factor RimP
VTRAPNGSPAVRDRIESELAGPLGALGLDVEAVEVTLVGSRQVLRVAVDGDDGVTLDTIADATRVVSGTLDESDVMGERAYTLEVTSRGVDRPLTHPRHWRRNVDRLVTVTFAAGGPESTEGLADGPVTGRITAAGDDYATLDVDGTERRVAYVDVLRAQVQIEFNRRTQENT